MILPPVTITVKPLPKLLKSQGGWLSFPLVPIVASVAEEARDRVRKRGKLYDGTPTPQYHPKTQKQRAKRGAATGSRRYDNTGTMWNSLQAKLRSPAEAVVTFAGKTRKGQTAHEAAKIIKKDLGLKTLTQARKILNARKEPTTAQLAFLHNRDLPSHLLRGSRQIEESAAAMVTQAIGTSTFEDIVLRDQTAKLERKASRAKAASRRASKTMTGR